MSAGIEVVSSTTDLIARAQAAASEIGGRVVYRAAFTGNQPEAVNDQPKAVGATVMANTWAGRPLPVGHFLVQGQQS